MQLSNSLRSLILPLRRKRPAKRRRRRLNRLAYVERLEDRTLLSTASLIAIDPNASEWDPMMMMPDSGYFSIERSSEDLSQPLTVNYTIGGTAANGTDYAAISSSVTIEAWMSSATVWVNPFEDQLAEGTEDVVLTLSAGGYTIDAVNNSGTVTITDAPSIDPTGSFGVAWEGGTLDFFVTATTTIGTISSYQIDIDQNGTFDTSGSHDPDIDGAMIMDVDLLFLLGSPVDDGDYTGTLRVALDLGYSADFDVAIRVGNVPPQITLSHPDNVDPGAVFPLTIGSSDPGPDTISSMTIDWGDGSPSENYSTGSGLFNHVYAVTGEYTLTVTLFDEDGSNAIDWIVDIGDTNAPDPVITDPQITFAEAVILPSGEAELTVAAYDQNGDEVVLYEWDLDGDGLFNDAVGPTVLLQPGSDFFPYNASVKVTDAAGNTDEALFAFAGAGAVSKGPTINTYRKKFLQATPDTPAGWPVHHTKQKALAERYLKQKGINIHENQYLRAVIPKVHIEIDNAQKAWWKKKAKSLTAQLNQNVTVQQAYWLVPWNEVEAFEAKLQAEYSQWWLASGNRQKTKVSKILNSFNSSRSRFVTGKGQRWRNLGFTALTGIALLDLFAKNAKAANNIANHNAAQLAKWNALATQYDIALEEVVRINRLTKNRGLFLKDAFIAYWTSLEIDPNAINLMNFGMIRWIEKNLHD